MTTFEEYKTSQTIKMLYMGESGAGKTGSLISLAAMGYNVRILDLDKGVDVLKDLVTNEDSPYRHDSGKPNAKLPGWVPIKGLWTEEQGQSIAKRISFVQLDETMEAKVVNKQSRMVPKGDLASKIIDQFDDWKEGEKSLGGITDWTINDVLIIDGMTRFTEALLEQQLAINSALTSGVQLQHYGAGQRELRRNLKLLFSSMVPCHVVIICHLDYIEMDNGLTRGLPKSLLGKSQASEFGTFFNHALLAVNTGSGANEKRVVKTNTSGLIQLKNAAPLRVKPEYNLCTALAEYWRDVRGE